MHENDLSIELLNDEDQEGSGLTLPLNDFVLSDVSYGVDVCNCFACLLVELTPDDCADPTTIRSDCPESICMNSSCLTPQLSPAISFSSNSSSVLSSHGTHPAVLVVSKAENISFKKFCLLPVQTKPSLPSDDASSGVCETVAPPDNLKDLFFTFNNLSSCNLSNMVEQFSESVGGIFLPWVAVYLVERAYIEPNLHTLYLHFLDHLADLSVNTP